MTILHDWPAALEAAGVNVRTLKGWEEPANRGYYWREPDGEPAGMMHHHTASPSYTPNRDKASAYAGLSYRGSDRLHQERYQGAGYEATFTIANAYPAPISSGAGVRKVLEQFVKENIPFTGRPGSDDSPKWYGNTHYINVEWVLDGTGSYIDQEVWEMMVIVCQVTNDLMTRPKHLWTPARHVAHGHHTGRKIDLWGGQFSNTNKNGFDKTLEALRLDMEGGEDVLKLGDTGEDVRKQQNYLNRWKNDPRTGGDYASLPDLVEDGVFGAATEDRTKDFQSWAAVEITGIINLTTGQSIAIAVKADRGEIE